jgi:hypothetical protein
MKTKQEIFFHYLKYNLKKQYKSDRTDLQRVEMLYELRRTKINAVDQNYLFDSEKNRYIFHSGFF